MILTIFKNSFLILLALFVVVPILAFAHQPRITEDRETTVTEPEVSKAYYGQLTGAPDVYTIKADYPFNLYVNILIPYSANQKTDVSATIFKNEEILAVLDGSQFTWTKMFEPFGYDTYSKGPEYTAKVDAGTYSIHVTSTNNNSKYSLAIGEIENFDFKEILNALTLVPQIKSDFFEESPINFILSPFGWGLILTLYILAGVVGFTYRFVLRKIAKNNTRKVSRNIGTPDRLVRLLIGIALLLWAITTSWNPVLIFLSGFALFEALFSWCGLYAALGKNTC